MENYLKLLKKLPKPLRLKLIQANLNIKCLSQKHGLYRCRIGKVRVLYQTRDEGNYILDMGFRGDVYKNLNNHL